MENLKNNEQEAPKKKTTRKKATKPKSVKLTIKETISKTVEDMKAAVKEGRGKELNTSSCARINKAIIELNHILRTLK